MQGKECSERAYSKFSHFVWFIGSLSIHCFQCHASQSTAVFCIRCLLLSVATKRFSSVRVHVKVLIIIPSNFATGPSENTECSWISWYSLLLYYHLCRMITKDWDKDAVVLRNSVASSKRLSAVWHRDYHNWLKRIKAREDKQQRGEIICLRLFSKSKTELGSKFTSGMMALFKPAANFTLGSMRLWFFPHIMASLLHSSFHTRHSIHLNFKISQAIFSTVCSFGWTYKNKLETWFSNQLKQRSANFLINEALRNVSTIHKGLNHAGY